jgi:hypothetical protein
MQRVHIPVRCGVAMNASVQWKWKKEGSRTSGETRKAIRLKLLH